MILGTLSQETVSDTLARRIQFATNFLRVTDFSAMAEGRHAVNDWMYFLVQKYETKNSRDAKFEAHRKYADLQYIIRGQELMACCDICQTKELAPFDEEKDCGKYVPEGSFTEFSVGAGQYALFLPQDCHKPSYHADGSSPCFVEKIVVKLLVQ